MKLALSLLTALVLTSLPLSSETLRLMSYNIRVDSKKDNPRWAERRDPMAKQISFSIHFWSHWHLQ